MRIIKEGKLKPEVPRRTICSKCDTLFEYLESETRTLYRKRTYGHDRSCTINCPLCHALITLD